MTDESFDTGYDSARQAAAERRAASFMSLPEVESVLTKLRSEIYDDRASGSRDQQATLDQVLEEVAYAGLLWTSTNDPANPQVVWFNQPPHMVGSARIPGGRFGTDSPDRVYRYFAVDPQYKYELRGRRSLSAPPSQFFLEACEDKPAAWGFPLKFLLSDEIVYEPDGSFVITLDATPANGRKNHLQLPEGSAHVMVRDTLLDWGNELPTQVSVRRVDGAQEIAPISESQIRSRAAQAIEDQSYYGLWWFDHPVVGVVPSVENEALNVFVRPSAPGQKAWGITAPGTFKIADDEAVIITVNKQTASAISAMITDRWMISRDYLGHVTALNNTQAWSNPDNSITFIIAKSDPGYANWLDTVGLNEFAYMLRMEIFEEDPDPDAVIKDISIVKLADLPESLPHAMPTITPEERAAQIALRQQQYAKRVAILRQEPSTN